jgi:hypothetical protein
LAEEAVQIGPVSNPNFPDNLVKTGNSAEKQPFPEMYAFNHAVISIPYGLNSLLD